MVVRAQPIRSLVVGSRGDGDAIVEGCRRQQRLVDELAIALRGEPLVGERGRDEDRHAVVHVGEMGGRGAHHDRVAGEPFAIGGAAALRDGRHTEQGALAHAELVPHALGLLHLEPAGRRHQRAGLERAGALLQALGSGVDRRELRGLPADQEPPPGGFEHGLGLGLHHDRVEVAQILACGAHGLTRVLLGPATQTLEHRLVGSGQELGVGEPGVKSVTRAHAVRVRPAADIVRTARWRSALG